MNIRLLALLLVCIALVTACNKHTAPTPAVTGTISYRTPLKLTGPTRLELQLTDVSISDGPAVDVATVRISDVTQLPYRYSLPYDAARIKPEHRYTIAARLYENDTLKYATDNAIEVLTQGKRSDVDFSVAATGGTEATALTTAASNITVFQGELRTATEVALYRVGFEGSHPVWLEEDRSNGTPQPLHARYDFKGALLLHYRDNSTLEIVFNDNGKPTGMTRDAQTLVVAQQMNVVNGVRNRAALLRSHALAARESEAHRRATKNDVSG